MTKSSQWAKGRQRHLSCCPEHAQRSSRPGPPPGARLTPAAWRRQRPYLVALVGVPDQKAQEVEPGALPDEDEVGGAVPQVGGRGEALGAPGTSAGHVGGVDGQELPAEDLPLLHLL